METNNSSTNQGNIVIGLLIGLVLALIPSYYFYTKYQDAQNKLNNPDIVAKAEIQSVTDKLSKLMVLPKDEQPTVATVTDKAKLKEQPFFARAENGDKVILYINAKKAILFREKDNKIIDVAPINITQQATPSGAIDAVEEGGEAAAAQPTSAVAPSPSSTQ